MKPTDAILLALCAFCLTIACLPVPSASATKKAQSVRIDTGQAASYAVWQEGALIRLSQSVKGVHGKNSAVRADLTGPNGATGAESGSFYHILPENKRDWSGAEFVRFWINNASAKPLLCSFSFKETASEDWGLDAGGTFFLQDADGMYYAAGYEYSNLEIPAQYEGYVILPFASMTVPEWSTAHGDCRLELSGIETYAFGAQFSGEAQTFYLDDITVASDPDARIVSVRLSEPAIEIPKAAATNTLIDTSVTDLSGAYAQEDVLCTLEKTYPGIALSGDGTLTVEPGAEPANVEIKAAVSGKPQYSHRFTVYVVKDKAAPLPTVSPRAGQSPAPGSALVPSRPMPPGQIAVIVAVGVCVLILASAIISAKARKKRSN